MLHAKGVDVVQASKWLGHKTAVTTLKFYTHLTEEKERANVAIADSVFSSVANRLPEGDAKA
jgi:integrase